MNSTPKLKDPSLLKLGVCFVDGEWVQAASSKTFEVHDPATGQLIGRAPEFNAGDTEKAIGAAAAAFPLFKKTTPRERSIWLRRWFELVAQNSEDLAALITWENGKPLVDSRAEMNYGNGFIEWFSEEATRSFGETIPSSFAAKRVITIREPVGVCSLITPWNFPAAMITRKVAPALAAGCTVVCKAPGETPFTSLALAELASRAGIPKGVINIVTGLDNTVEIGETLTTHPTIHKISFTGSTGVGKLLMKQASLTLKKLSMELGGNAPFLIFDDANLEDAVEGALACKFRGSGQTCVCANRIYVQSGIHGKFTARFAERVEAFKLGNGFAKDVTHGPLIHDRAVAKVESHIKDALSKGGKVITGGKALPELGTNFFQPTIITGMTEEMAIATEETFGPVAAIFPFTTEKEVIERANASSVGLAGYIYSRDVERVVRVAEALEVGMVGVNTGIISDVVSPFGGVKESGFGREGSKVGLTEYQNIKSITLGGCNHPLEG